MVERLLYIIQVWLETYRVLRSQRKGFAAGFVRQLGHAVLTEVYFPKVATDAPDTASEDGMDDCSSSLSHSACRIDIGICGKTKPRTATGSIDSVCHHHDFTAVRMRWPALH